MLRVVPSHDVSTPPLLFSLFDKARSLR
jgi:hypothetical protein